MQSNKKRAYHAPVLRDHGTVAEITLAGGADPGDFDGLGYGAPAAPTS
ncbi:MAG: lasso RiPP family leader peptide-containing protein [Gemmatimonas sp.]